MILFTNVSITEFQSTHPYRVRLLMALIRDVMAVSIHAPV